ncbi:MAG: DNA-directed RNA polymerase subunit D [Candidatus Diapherotrites archaeon]
MDVKVLEEKNDTLKLLFKDTNPETMNAIRRHIMNAIPVFAIEDVHIYENTGVMFDEMLAHRLGLIPLKMDSADYKEGEKVKMILEKEGPCVVYSKDIKSTDPTIEPAFMNIPITKLEEGQKIKLEMDAITGTGKQHSKFQPALVTYQEIPIVVSEKGGKDKSYKADMIELLINKGIGSIKLKQGERLEYDNTSFIMTIESFGNLSPKLLLEKSIEILTQKLGEFRRELKNLS